MPDVVRLRNLHGFEVEVDVRGPNPGSVIDGELVEFVDVPGRLVTDEAEYRQLLELPEDTPVSENMAGCHWVYGPLESIPGTHLRGWPKATWELVTDEPSTVDTEE